MARLPDETAISGPSIGGAGRPIASVDTTGYSRGADAIARAYGAGGAAMAAGDEALGKGLTSAGGKVADVAKMWEEDDQKLEIARAKSDFLTQKVQLDSSLDGETDHATLPGRYSAKLGEIQQGAAANITNARTRELFTLSTADDVARGNALADKTANKLWADATVADTTTRLESTRQAALKSTDPVERQRLIQTGNDLITSLADKDIITKESAAKTRQEWTTKYAAGAISMLPAEDRVKVLGGFEGALTKFESGGKPDLLNQFGYAGLYQFGAPRLAAMGVYKPGDNEDLKNWSKTSQGADGKWSGTFDIPGHPEIRTIDQFLRSPDAQRAAFNIHSSKMDEEIQSNGLDKYIGQTVGGVNITREGLHAMLHLGGVGGTKDALEGKRNATDANGTSVLQYAQLGNQSDLTRVASLLPEDTRVRMRNEAQNEVDRGVAKAAAAQSETWERKIIDAGAGVGTLPPRADIEADPALDEPRRNVLLRQYDSAAGDVAGLQRFMTKFKDPNGGSFNPYDTEEKKYVDKAFTALGGDNAALQAVVARTGIVPKSAAVGMRGSMVSNDPKRVADALTVTSNLINANPNAFVGVDGQKDFENNAVAFRHYVDDLGMTANDAANKIIQQQSPEYQAMKAKIKPEDIDAKIKKDLSVGDLAHQFDQIPWIPFTDPKVGFDPKQRLEMYSQFAEGVKDHYLETGDWDLAKKQSAADLKKTWGVSSVNGSQTVMQYPPERAPAYAGLTDPAAAISKQAIEAVKVESNTDVERKNIRLQPIPGVTAQAYKEGQPPPYMLMWTDKENVVHMLNPGRAFVADPVQMKDAQSDQRRNALDKGQAEIAPLLDMRASRKATADQLRSEARQRILADTPSDLGPDAFANR